jgi:hypothetical protein
LLLRLHTETACRRGGALALRLTDLDVTQGLVRLREKGETLRWQPITVDLAMRLSEHAAARGAVLPVESDITAPDGLFRERMPPSAVSAVSNRLRENPSESSKPMILGSSGMTLNSMLISDRTILQVPAPSSEVTEK